TAPSSAATARKRSRTVTWTIWSFTVGAGYVPAKDFLLEAFYTFGAKGIGKRDTLYGPESFKLGDYTRVQATYKF
ncbi:hypothetical protein, partial [Anaeroglobus geminatus]